MWPKFRFSTKLSISDRKFWRLPKIWIADQNFEKVHFSAPLLRVLEISLYFDIFANMDLLMRTHFIYYRKLYPFPFKNKIFRICQFAVFYINPLNSLTPSDRPGPITVNFPTIISKNYSGRAPMVKFIKIKIILFCPPCSLVPKLFFLYLVILIFEQNNSIWGDVLDGNTSKNLGTILRISFN